MNLISAAAIRMQDGGVSIWEATEAHRAGWGVPSATEKPGQRAEPPALK